MMIISNKTNDNGHITIMIIRTLIDRKMRIVSDDNINYENDRNSNNCGTDIENSDNCNADENDFKAKIIMVGVDDNGKKKRQQ